MRRARRVAGPGAVTGGGGPALAPGGDQSHRVTAVTGSYVNHERKCFSAAIRTDSVPIGGQIAQQTGSMMVVPDAGEPLSPQAAT